MASPVTRTLARLPRRAGPLVRGRRFLGRFTLDVASEVTPWRLNTRGESTPIPGHYQGPLRLCTEEARGGARARAPAQTVMIAVTSVLTKNLYAID